jgi:hypothetical protein
LIGNAALPLTSIPVVVVATFRPHCKAQYGQCVAVTAALMVMAGARRRPAQACRKSLIVKLFVGL